MPDRALLPAITRLDCEKNRESRPGLSSRQRACWRRVGYGWTSFLKMTRDKHLLIEFANISHKDSTITIDA
jgi:hypothetical protein